MAAKRILFHDGNQLVAFLWRGGHVSQEAEFQPEPVGYEALEAYLRSHGSSIFYLLADVPEEGFQLEDIPRVAGRDRIAILKRRLGQYYYGTPLAVALSLGRKTDGRKDESILFTGLTRPEDFAPWLDAIRAAGAILAGIYSVPLLLFDGGLRLAGITTPNERLLLITLTRAGVRQSFFENGRLHFSRLTQLATRGLEETAIACASESAKIHQYLVGQRQIPRGSTLRTVVLAHGEQIPALRTHCRETGDLHFDFVDLADSARRQGLKTPLLDSRGEALFVHLLAVRTPPRQFARSPERKLYFLWRTRFALAAIAWIVLGGCLLYAVKTGLQYQDARQRIDLIAAQTAADTQRYQAILDALPKIPLSPDNLRALIGRHDEVERRADLFVPLLAHLSRSLSAMPRIELVRLHWSLSDRPEGEGKVSPGGTAPKSSAAAGATWSVIDVDAQLPLGLASDLRAQIAAVDQLAESLRSGGHEVTVLSRPFDVEPGKPLRNQVAPGAATEAPRFSLRLAKKL